MEEEPVQSQGMVGIWKTLFLSIVSIAVILGGGVFTYGVIKTQDRHESEINELRKDMTTGKSADAVSAEQRERLLETVERIENHLVLVDEKLDRLELKFELHDKRRASTSNYLLDPNEKNVCMWSEGISGLPKQKERQAIEQEKWGLPTSGGAAERAIEKGVTGATPPAAPGTTDPNAPPAGTDPNAPPGNMWSEGLSSWERQDIIEARSDLGKIQALTDQGLRSLSPVASPENR